MGGGTGSGHQDADQRPPELSRLELPSERCKAARERSAQRQEHGGARIRVHDENDLNGSLELFRMAQPEQAHTEASRRAQCG